jgi:hypothetical protein
MREKNLHDHLLAGEQAVGDELASSDGDLSVSHDCSRWEVEDCKWGMGCRNRDVAVRFVKTARSKCCRTFSSRCGLACETLGDRGASPELS